MDTIVNESITTNNTEKKPFILVENVLSEEELDFIWKFLEASQHMFVSTAFEDHPEIRKSHVLTLESLPIFEILSPKLTPVLYQGLSYFNVTAPLNWVQIEYQCTRSANGEFYRAHRDRAPEEIKEIPTLAFKRTPKKKKSRLKKYITVKDPHIRALTYVYYFHKPNVFTGGELWMEPDYNLKMPHNSLIVFDPRSLHAVKVVQCDENATWLNARWTLNGWVSEYKLEDTNFLEQKLEEIAQIHEEEKNETLLEKNISAKKPITTLSASTEVIQRRSRRHLQSFLE